MSELVLSSIRKKGWRKEVSKKQVKLRRAILLRAKQTGRMTAEDGDFLLRFDEKTRVCEKCGNTYSMLWNKVYFTTKDGEKVACGLTPLCFDCEMEELIMK